MFSKSKQAGGLGNGSALKITGSIPSPHTAARNCLQLWFQESDILTRTYMPAKHQHTLNKNETGVRSQHCTSCLEHGGKPLTRTAFDSIQKHLIRGLYPAPQRPGSCRDRPPLPVTRLNPALSRLPDLQIRLSKRKGQSLSKASLTVWCLATDKLTWGSPASLERHLPRQIQPPLFPPKCGGCQSAHHLRRRPS